MGDRIEPRDTPEFTSPEEWFHNLATRYVEVQIYFHLNQCGVFQELQNPVKTDKIAAVLNLDERILHTLLDYAANVGDILEQDEEQQFRLTEFGARVLDRYSKKNGDQISYNMFDVRTGAWGPVWNNLGEMLKNNLEYGVDFVRSGNFAADGLFKLAAPLGPSVKQAATSLDATAIVEIGPTSGLLAQLSTNPDNGEFKYVGLDVKQESLDDARKLADARGENQIEWLLGNVNNPENWIDKLDNHQSVLYFSCHFHEFLSHGQEKLEEALTIINNRANTCGTLVLEQPRLNKDDRNLVPPTKWLYAQSNVLIHHLIKNAKILDTDEWNSFLRKSGCHDVSVESTRGYGFSAFVGQSQSSLRTL